MQRSTLVAVIAVALAIFGVYIATYVPPLLVGPRAPLLLLAGFVIQACAALLAALGVWQGTRWAPGMVILLGAAIAATELAEGFVLGVISYDHALAVSLVALLVAIGVAVYVGRVRVAGA
jgi:hypothetical protein